MRSASAMGITRVSAITGLDHLGIPVCQATRPNAQSLSVSQGKGVSIEAAAASALMEAVELFHGEDLAPRARIAAIGHLDAVDLATLPRSDTRIDPGAEIAWIEGVWLDSEVPVWVPLALVGTDYRRPGPEGAALFAASTNGLASGNHPIEAVLAGICEVIERDAVARWTAGDARARANRLLDLDSVDDPGCLTLIAQCRRARMRLIAWDVTSEIGVPVLSCSLADPAGHAAPLRPVAGSGCHPDPAVALSRAITEAAQARLTRIAGARDDLTRADFVPQADADIWDAVMQLRPPQRRTFTDIAGFVSDDLAADLAWVLYRLAATNRRPIVVDLTQPAFAIPVIRALIPGLLGPQTHRSRT